MQILQPSIAAVFALAASLNFAPATLFDHLQACDVPGVRERVLGRGPHTVAFAGEFLPTTNVQWTTSKRKIYLYIVSGRGVVRIGKSTTSARAGDFFVLPQRLRHAISANAGAMRAIYVEDKS